MQTVNADSTWVRDANTATLEPKVDKDDNVNIGEGNLDANAVVVDDVLITEYISGATTERLGSNLKTSCADFSCSTGWSIERGWSISGGVANWEAEGTDDELLPSDITLEAGVKYRITFDIVSIDLSGGSVFELVDHYPLQQIGSWDSTGSKSVDYTPSQSNNEITFSANDYESSSDSVTIDNFSIVEVISETEVRDVFLDPNLFVENDLDAGGDANVAGSLTVGGNISGTNSNWDDAYTKRVDTWTFPLTFSSNTASIADANSTKKGKAKFSAYDFDVIDGEVFIHNTYTLSDDVLHNNATSRVGDNGATYPQKLKETKINAGIGSNVTLRISFDLTGACNGSTCQYVYGQIYRNGSAVGTLRETEDNNTETHTEDISGWSNGDLLQVWGYTAGNDEECEVENLKVKGTITGCGTVSFTDQDP
jgi:hypothetical protein